MDWMQYLMAQAYGRYGRVPGTTLNTGPAYYNPYENSGQAPLPYFYDPTARFGQPPFRMDEDPYQALVYGRQQQSEPSGS